MGLGYLGLNNQEKAKTFLARVQKADINHQGAQVHLKGLQ